MGGERRNQAGLRLFNANAAADGRDDVSRLVALGRASGATDAESRPPMRPRNLYNEFRELEAQHNNNTGGKTSPPTCGR